MKPLVSIVVPAYNASKTIVETLDSINNQTYKNFECFVIDDGSLDSDELYYVIEKFLGCQNFSYIRKENGGVSSARNLGASKASGEFLMFVDSDDMIAPTYIEKCLNEYQRNPDLSLVCTNVQEFERSALKISHDIVPLSKFIFHNAIFPCIALIRKESFHKIGGYDEALKVCEDWNLYIALLKENANYQVINEHLYFYRKRADQTSLTDQIDNQTISMNTALNRIFVNHRELYDQVMGSPWAVMDRTNSVIKLSKKGFRNLLILGSLTFLSWVIYYLFDLDAYVLCFIFLNLGVLFLSIIISLKLKKAINVARY